MSAVGTTYKTLGIMRNTDSSKKQLPSHLGEPSRPIGTSWPTNQWLSRLQPRAQPLSHVRAQPTSRPETSQLAKQPSTPGLWSKWRWLQHCNWSRVPSRFFSPLRTHYSCRVYNLIGVDFGAVTDLGYLFDFSPHCEPTIPVGLLILLLMKAFLRAR